MNINDYYKVKNYLDDTREMVREAVLHSLLLYPEDYPDFVTKCLNEGYTLRVTPEFDEGDTPYKVDLISPNNSPFPVNVQADVLYDVQISWEKEKEVEECCQTFEARAVGKVYGMILRSEIESGIPKIATLKTETGHMVYNNLKFIPTSSDDQRARFSMKKNGNTGEKLGFCIKSDLLTVPHMDITQWQYWDEINQH